MSDKISAQVNMEVKCDLCDNDSNVKWKCIDCDEWLCLKCKSIHTKSRASRDHKLANLMETDFSSLEEMGKQCSEHRNESYQMYCKNCECLLCLVCVTGKHKQHEFVTLFHITEVKRNEIQEYLEKLKTIQLTELKRSMLSLKQTQADHSDQTNVCAHEVKKQSQLVKKEMDIVMGEFLNDVQQTASENQEKMNRLGDQISKRISFIQKRIKRCEERRKTQNPLKLIKLASEMKSALERYGDYSPNWNIEFPSFVPETIDRFDMQHLFGKIDYEYVDNRVKRGRTTVSVTLHTNIKILSQFTNNVRSYSIATDKESVWIGRDKYLAQMDSEGRRLKWVNLDFDIYCIATTKSGDLLLGSSNKIYKLLKEGFFVDFVNFEMWFVTDISITEENEILVCLRDIYIGKPGKVVRLTERGQYLQTIKYTKDGEIMYKWPEYLTHTREDDIWVTDTKDNCVVVASSDGNLKFRYTGFADILMNQDFQPRGILTNKYEQILIADINNHAIHLVDREGHFLQFLLTTHHGITCPTALSQDQDGALWVVCNDGKIINISYIT